MHQIGEDKGRIREIGLLKEVRELEGRKSEALTEGREEDE